MERANECFAGGFEPDDDSIPNYIESCHFASQSSNAECSGTNSGAHKQIGLTKPTRDYVREARDGGMYGHAVETSHD